MRANQIEMAMKQRQAQIAMGQAMGREQFHYYSILVGLVYFFLPLGAIKTHNPKMLAPLLPLGFMWTF